MRIALCYESVLPERGGCETYISDIARRLDADGHQVHLFACRWDESVLPKRMVYHALPQPLGPRFVRPWRFSASCIEALRQVPHDVSIGFNKTWGQDVLYPQGGLHAASFDYNLRKFDNPLMRRLSWLGKQFDPAHRSFMKLERQQYLSNGEAPQIIVNSFMVRRHFQHYYGIPTERVHVVRSSIDPARFSEHDRPRARLEARQRWDISPRDVVALFAATNYRLKGLEPLLRAVQRLCARGEFRRMMPPFTLVVAGSPKTARYEKLARALGVADYIKFVGHCSPMREGYFAADFLVHPTFYDPCSLVVLEALSCALPVITTRMNGACELMQQAREGYVIDDPHDHNHLAWCLSQLLDQGHRAVCAQAARKTAAKWTFEHHYQALTDVFAKVVARKRAA